MKKQNIEVKASVAIIRCELPNPSYLLLRRASRPEDPWSGHYSFPGGRREPRDDSLLTTCLRETREETGIELSENQLIKTLQPEAAGKNFQLLLWVQPFVFSLAQRPQITLEATEVVDSVWVDEREFANPKAHKETEMVPGRLFPAFPLKDYFLWGFSYKLLLKLVTGEPYNS